MKVAAPAASVVATALVSVPPGPEATEAVMALPAVGTALPKPSRSWTTGAGTKALPLATVAGGCVVMESCEAGPTDSTMFPLTTGV